MESETPVAQGVNFEWAGGPHVPQLGLGSTGVIDASTKHANRALISHTHELFKLLRLLSL